MLKALEIFWLSLTIFCFLALAFAVYTGSRSEILLLGICALVAGFKYYVRRKQRRQIDNNKR